MVDRLISCLMALSLAFLVWLYARGRDQESIDNVPITVHLVLASAQSEQYDLQVTGPSQVLVSFTGPHSRMRELRGMFQRGEVRVGITLAVPEERQNQSRFLDTVCVEAADVPAPPGVSAVVLEGRNRIPVIVHRLIERRLPVRFDQAPEDGIAQVTMEPATVLVRGPQEILERARAIATQPYALPQRADTALEPQQVSLGRVPLVRELEGRPIRPTPAAVTVRLTVRPRQRIYELKEVAVHFLCPANFSLRPHFRAGEPGKIAVRVLGPASDVPPPVTAYVDLSAGQFEPGLYVDKPVRLQLPREFELAQDPPRAPAFQLVPAADGVSSQEPGDEP